jgi:hypothetical protein
MRPAYPFAALRIFSGSSQGISTPHGDDAGMTLTLAIVINAILMAGIVAAVAHVIHLPQRFDRRRKLETAVYVPGEDGLERAA